MKYKIWSTEWTTTLFIVFIPKQKSLIFFFTVLYIVFTYIWIKRNFISLRKYKHLQNTQNIKSFLFFSYIMWSCVCVFFFSFPHRHWSKYDLKILSILHKMQTVKRKCFQTNLFPIWIQCECYCKWIWGK